MQWWLDRSVRAKALMVLSVPLIVLFGTMSASLVLVVRRNATNGLEDAIGALDIAGLALGLIAVLAGIALFSSGVSRRVDLIAARDEVMPAIQAKSDVSVFLDPAADLPAPDSESTEPLPTRRAARPGANLWVLYIEDNPANVEVVARYLSNRTHAHLASYPSGHEGYEYAAANRPDIILLDLHVQDPHGEETLSRLMADPVTADIPVVVLCADASPGMIGRLITAGALAYLTKPLDLNELGAILDSLPAPTLSEIDKHLA